MFVTVEMPVIIVTSARCQGVDGTQTHSSSVSTRTQASRPRGPAEALARVNFDAAAARVISDNKSSRLALLSPDDLGCMKTRTMVVMKATGRLEPALGVGRAGKAVAMVTQLLVQLVLVSALLRGGDAAGPPSNVDERLELARALGDPPAQQHSVMEAEGAQNIVFFLSDDMGPGDVTFNRGGKPRPDGRDIVTPRLDKLASQAKVFSEAYAGAPVCAPSRCTLMCGRHSGHCTVRSNGPSLNATDDTMASMLQRAGYRTGLIGKWGLGSNGTVAAPRRKGFDFFYGYTSQENAHVRRWWHAGHGGSATLRSCAVPTHRSTVF